ncbi:MAG: NAD(P)-binding domain-containing protein, partial [Armatimonadota bacterium]
MSEVKTELTLMEKIKNKTARLAVVGLGYVGLPLAVEFAKAGFEVTGIDDNKAKVDKVNKGENYIIKEEQELLKGLVDKKKIKAEYEFAVLKEVDVVFICVPTPLTKHREPDISYVKSVTDQTAKYLKRGHLIILESTTYPGTTEEVMLPILSSNGYKVGEDFYLAFSPERVDPGNKIY